MNSVDWLDSLIHPFTSSDRDPNTQQLRGRAGSTADMDVVAKMKIPVPATD